MSNSNNNNNITLTKEQFTHINKIVKSAVAGKTEQERRPALTYAKLDINEEGYLRIIALDGVKMVVSTLEDGSSKFPEDFKCLYRPVTAPAKAKTVSIEELERTCRISFYGGNNELISIAEVPPLKEEWYEKWEDLFRQTAEGAQEALSVDPAMLIEALQAHSVARSVTINLSPKGGWVDSHRPIVLESNSGSRKTKTLLMPTR